MKERRLQEIQLLEKEFGRIDVGDALDWLIIRNFPLPEGWSLPSTDLLIFVPSGYPNIPPDNFYANNDLKIKAMNQKPDRSSPNVQKLDRQWLQFSFHVDKGSWRPHADLLHGHNLLTFIQGVKQRLLEVN